MGFFKKLVKGVKKAVKGVTKVVSAATGFAGKILPNPFGSIAKTASKITGFAGKLLEGASGGGGGGTKATTARAIEEAPQAVFSDQKKNDISIDLGSKNWFEKNMAWVIPTGIAVVGLIIGVITLLFKRKR